VKIVNFIKITNGSDKTVVMKIKKDHTHPLLNEIRVNSGEIYIIDYTDEIYNVDLDQFYFRFKNKSRKVSIEHLKQRDVLIQYFYFG
jgi:hypothetical protein